MAGPGERDSTELDRRASTWSSIAQRDDEDYDAELYGISDGFRPTNTTHMNDDANSSRPSNNTTLPTRRLTPPPRPSSATKPRTIDAFALRHDGAMGHIGHDLRAVSTSASTPTRSSSISTDTAAFVRFDEPYQGPSGPSHPYQMYPQESRIARTASVVTSSTTVQAPRERSYAGPSGPTHPYGMYPQSTVPLSDTASVNEDTSRPPPIPIGFPGSNNHYQRRLGPDGEEIADLIGPDGHTEQLPPYTKYPDVAFIRKTRPSVRTSASGAGGIGLATRNPEFESQEDINSPASRQSIRSTTSTHLESQPQLVSTGPEMSEKSRSRRWQQTARRKICCGIIPIWAVVLAATILVLFTIILGAALGSMKNRDNDYEYNEPYESIVYTTLTTTFDASPFTTPPSALSQLPTGTYALPVTAPSAVQSSCFAQTVHSKAWSCAMPNSPLQVQVFALPKSDPLTNHEIVLDYGNETFGNVFPYGTQPPVLEDPQILQLVVDTQEPHRGPAWFFQTTYDKLVVVEEDLLSSPYESRDLDSRQEPNHYDQPVPAGFLRRNIAQQGDMPWFCYWNDTLIEAFLYTDLTSSEAVHSARSSVAPTTTTSSMPTSTSNSTSTSDDDDTYKPKHTSVPWPIHNLLRAYPKVMKVQERRIPRALGSLSPYCVKKQIQADGSAKDVLNRSGQPIVIQLDETIPEDLSPILRRGSEVLKDAIEERAAAEVRERQLPTGSCGCVWLAT